MSTTVNTAYNVALDIVEDETAISVEAGTMYQVADVTKVNLSDGTPDWVSNGRWNVATKTSNYTLTISDYHSHIRANKSSAISVTIPPNADVALKIGTELQVEQIGSGATTIVAGTGVTIRAEVGLVLNAQYAVAKLVKVATNEWIAYGSLKA